MKLSRELKTGLVAVVIIGLFIWGYNFMKGQDLFNKSPRTYFATYNNVGGLNTASQVTINGLSVGHVLNITFNKDPDHKGQLIVEFGVNNDFKFSKNSVAKIYSASLMGGKSLAIEPSYVGENAESGDYLVGQIETDMMSSLSESMSPIQAKIEHLIMNTDSLMVNLNKVAKNDVKDAFAKLDDAIASFKRALGSFNHLIDENEDNLALSMSNFAKSSENLSKITDSIAQADLGKTIRDFQVTITSMNSILDGIDNGEGSIGKLMKDEGLYNNLENASKELEELLREVKEHPKRFVSVSMFGKKDKGYKPEEKE